MYIIVEENDNCSPDERVFSTSGPEREVARVLANRPDGKTDWCDIIGVDDKGVFVPPIAQRTEDSSDGTAWLIRGGLWGLRLRPVEKPTAWSLTDKTQWGVPFLVLDSSGTAIAFK